MVAVLRLADYQTTGTMSGGQPLVVKMYMQCPGVWSHQTRMPQCACYTFCQLTVLALSSYSSALTATAAASAAFYDLTLLLNDCRLATC
jgi:hypothetical protein